MTGAEAWRIISGLMDELFRYRHEIYPAMKKTYSMDEITAQVMAFEALRRLDEKTGDDDGDDRK